MAELEKKANVRVCQFCGGIRSMGKALNGCLELVQALGYIKSSDQDGVPGACQVLAAFLTPESQLITYCLGAVVLRGALRGQSPAQGRSFS